MFLDMANAGLIVIGASEYINQPELNRSAFFQGKEEVISYFKNIKTGLGIESKNILDIFNSAEPPHSQIIAIRSFINNGKFDDVFIYITGHGFTRNKDFYLFQNSSSHADINSCLNVTTMLLPLNSLGDYRIFAFIDACESGSFHIYDDNKQIIPTLLGYISSADASQVPRNGLSVLTSNNNKSVGVVLADDTLSEIKTPVFTYELLKLLKKGKPKDQRFGFSINSLRETLESRIEDTLLSLNRKDLLERSRPEVTDITEYNTASIAMLSDIGIFPNNDPSNSLIIKAAKRVRLTYSHIRNLDEEIADLIKVRNELEAEKDQLTSKTNELQAELDKEKNLRRKAQSGRTGFIYITFALSIFMIIALVVAFIVLSPAILGK